jgi:hypothetical protein
MSLAAPRRRRRYAPSDAMPPSSPLASTALDALLPRDFSGRAYNIFSGAGSDRSEAGTH